ncbi:MAG: hypothetical protein K5787_07240 [Lentisphaeria bacterium]|nr:hypothetical protein [Lentisphaeria bacterium]
MGGASAFGAAQPTDGMILISEPRSGGRNIEPRSGGRNTAVGATHGECDNNIRTA